MSIDEQPTQPIPIVCGLPILSDYRLLKRLSDLSGVRFVQVYLFIRGRKTSLAHLPRLNMALYMLLQERGM